MKLTDLIEKFICCPYDLKKLEITWQIAEADGTLCCTECKRTWSIVDGIISIMPDYYEDKKNIQNDIDEQDRLSEISTRDAQAKDYEQMFANRRDIIEIKTIMREFRVAPNDVVVELGVGSGRTLKYSERCKLVIGCDFSLKSLQELKAKGFKNVVALQTDATHLPLQNESIDKILSVGLFHHIPSQRARRKNLFECSRILRLNGEFLMSGVYNFTLRKRLRDIKTVYTKDDKHCGAEGKMGYHTNNTIYYYNFNIRELREEAERYFRVLNVFGFLKEIGLIGRIMEKIFGPYRVDYVWQHTKIGNWFGRLLLIRMAKAIRTSPPVSPLK